MRLIKKIITGLLIVFAVVIMSHLYFEYIIARPMATFTQLLATFVYIVLTLLLARALFYKVLKN